MQQMLGAINNIIDKWFEDARVVDFEAALVIKLKEHKYLPSLISCASYPVGAQC